MHAILLVQLALLMEQISAIPAVHLPILILALPMLLIHVLGQMKIVLATVIYALKMDYQNA
jgi:hypothetical protein